jgi:hypothetical protein
MQRRALEIRQACARQASEVPIAPHPANDDEARYPTRIGTDTRALPHNARGEVDQAAWQALFDACQSGDPADFEKIPLGGTRRLGNPVGPLAVSLAGITPTQIAIPAAPALASAERAAEAVEVYWQALLRDVPFSDLNDVVRAKSPRRMVANQPLRTPATGPTQPGHPFGPLDDIRGAGQASAGQIAVPGYPWG